MSISVSRGEVKEYHDLRMGIESNHDSLVHHNAKFVTYWGLDLALRKDHYNDFMKTEFGTTMLKDAVF